MQEDNEKPNRSSAWYNSLGGEQKNIVLKKKREQEKKRREKAKAEKLQMYANHRALAKDNETLKQDNDMLASKVIHLNQSLNLQFTCIWENGHDKGCPRYQSRGCVDVPGRARRSVPNLLFSSIIPLRQSSILHVYVGWHNGRPMSVKKDREYHTSTWMQIEVHKHEAIVFDGNLCHAGGRSDSRCPRVFATFGTSYATLEGKNYIQQCMPCKLEGDDGCGDCNMLHQIKKKTSHDVLYGVEDTVTRFDVLSLFEHGFCLVDLSSLGEFSASLREEVDSLEGGGADINLSFVNMGQNEVVNDIRKRMRLGGDVQKVLQKKLPHTLQYIKSTEDIMTSRIQGEYVSKTYSLNESTIFINGETGADCQKVHMDNALLCTCFTKQS